MHQTLPEFEYLIAIGSNLGDREEHIQGAIELIGKSIGKPVRVATLYETAPVGAADQQFLNSALIVLSKLPPAEVLQLLLNIEKVLGRLREVHWGNRTIDLDIILVKKNGEPMSVSTESLNVPHPRLLERDFVLCPCAEIAPDWIHPFTLETLLDERKNRGFSLPI